MNRASLLRVLLLGMAVVMLGWSSEPALAAGGHAGGGFGGGGFHGGGYHGGGGGYHGGGWGGYHGGGGYGYRGAYGYRGGYGYRTGYGYRGGYGWGGYRGGYGYGWRGGWGGWGCCGWGFGLSFNFGWPYWGYSNYAYAPYYYPYYGYPTYPYPYYYAPIAAPQAYAQPVPNNQTSGAYQYGVPEEPTNNPASQSAPASNQLNSSQLNMYDANYVARPPAARTASTVSSATSYRPPAASGSSAVIRDASYGTIPNTREVRSARPEVENVIRALRAMPPQAGQRQLESGRYSNLSPAELQQVRKAVGLPPA